MSWRLHNDQSKGNNHQARQYLADTDWYVTRKAETGKAIPDDILTKREEARAKVKSI